MATEHESENGGGVGSSAWLGRGGVPGPALWRTISVVSYVIAWVEFFDGNQPIAWFAAGLAASLKADSLKRPNAAMSDCAGGKPKS